jgi:hypothetical protein
MGQTEPLMGKTFAAWSGAEDRSRPSIEYASEALQVTHRFEDLLANEPQGTPYDFKLLFSADGLLARQRSKQRFQLLKAIDPILVRLLRPGERVQFLTTGSLLSVAEHFFTEWAGYYLNLCALVFTTERLLLLQIDLKRHPREVAAQLAYPAIAQVTTTWDGYCQVGTRNGGRFRFAYIPRLDRRPLRELMGRIARQAPPANAAFPTAVQLLCPRCFKVVPGFPRACPACQAAFKSSLVATMWSGIFPGLGNRYLGQRGFARFALWSSALLWLGLVGLPLLRPLVTKAGSPGRGYWIAAATVLATVHLLSAALTSHYARKAHYPAVSRG